MRIKLLLFGAAAEALGPLHEGFALREGSAASDVAAALIAARPEAAAVLGSIAVAVNRRYVRPAHVLREGDEVALIPPVSGG